MVVTLPCGRSGEIVVKYSVIPPLYILFHILLILTNWNRSSWSAIMAAFQANLFSLRDFLVNVRRKNSQTEMVSLGRNLQQHTVYHMVGVKKSVLVRLSIPSSFSKPLLRSWTREVCWLWFPPVEWELDYYWVWVWYQETRKYWRNYPTRPFGELLTSTTHHYNPNFTCY